MFLVRCVLEIRCGWVGMVSLLQAEAGFHTLLQKHSFVIRQCMETHRLHASARWLLLEKQPGPFLRLSRHFKSVAKHAAVVKVYRPFDTVNFAAKCG